MGKSLNVGPCIVQLLVVTTNVFSEGVDGEELGIECRAQGASASLASDFMIITGSIHRTFQFP